MSNVCHVRSIPVDALWSVPVGERFIRIDGYIDVDPFTGEPEYLDQQYFSLSGSSIKCSEDFVLVVRELALRLRLCGEFEFHLAHYDAEDQLGWFYSVRAVFGEGVHVRCFDIPLPSGFGTFASSRLEELVSRSVPF